jgi:hypothetical protein
LFINKNILLIEIIQGSFYGISMDIKDGLGYENI